MQRTAILRGTVNKEYGKTIAEAINEKLDKNPEFELVQTTVLESSDSPYPENHSIGLGIALMLFGFLFISLGMYLYMSAEQGCGPKDGLLIAIGKRMPKIPIGVVEILLWAVVTFAGWLLGGSVGIGTLISVFVGGVVMHLFFDVIGFEPRKLKHKSLSETFRQMKQ